MEPTRDIHIAAVQPAEGDPLLVEAAALRASPRYGDAVQAYAAGLVRFRESSRLINKLSAHETRTRTVGYLLHLSALSRTQGGDGGVGYSELHDLCVARRGEVSPRVLKTMLSLLSFMGFVEASRNPADRRIKIYRPTPRMLDFAKQWFLHAAEALDALDPELERVRRLANDPAFLSRLLVDAGRDHAEGPPAERMPEFVDFFGRREGAAAIFARLLIGEFGHRPVDSRAALARQFGLSKTQVSDVIADGVALGYLDLGDGTMPALTETIRDIWWRWISIELAFYARHMRVE